MRRRENIDSIFSQFNSTKLPNKTDLAGDCIENIKGQVNIEMKDFL